MAVAWQSYFEEAKSAAHSYLKRISADLESSSLAVETRHLPGDPAANIIDLASRTPDSFIAMTSRGQGGLARAVLGSVADRVVRHAAEPVLVIRPK